jgi:hypothetical protein
MNGLARNGRRLRQNPTLYDMDPTMNTVAPNDIPYGRLDQRPHQMHLNVILTAYRAGGEAPVTVEMTLDQWLDLPPVQYVIKTELSRQQPRRPAGIANDPARAHVVPRGHIEWKDGQNWVVLTAYAAGTEEAVTVEVTLSQWFALTPVRYAVEERLERWQENKLWSQPR